MFDLCRCAQSQGWDLCWPTSYFILTPFIWLNGICFLRSWMHFLVKRKAIVSKALERPSPIQRAGASLVPPEEVEEGGGSCNGPSPAALAGR